MQCNNHSEEIFGACLRGYHINISKFDVISFFRMFYIIELHGINSGKKNKNQLHATTSWWFQEKQIVFNK